MPAQCRAGIPLTSDPPRAMSVGNADARLVVPPTTTGGRSSLLDFFFGLIGILLLFLQVCCGGEIGRSCAIRILAATRRRSGRNSLLALIVRKSLQTVVKLLAEAVMHFLKVGDLDSRRRIHATVRLLAAQDHDLNRVVAVRGVVLTSENVAGAERASLAAGGGIEAWRHYKDLKVGIERGRELVSTAGGLCLDRS